MKKTSLKIARKTRAVLALGLLLTSTCSLLADDFVQQSVTRGKANHIYREGNHIFFDLSQITNNDDRCHGFYISDNHPHFQEVFSMLMSSKSTGQYITVTSLKCNNSRSDYVKMRYGN